MSTVSLSMLADLLLGELEKHCADPSPVRDRSETELVDLVHRRGDADAFMAVRITHALQRLRRPAGPGGEAWRTGDAVHDALIVLGGYAHLCDLRKRVAA
ncbi:hypothetical protein GCM10010399_43860 [Dactylosporangium fulvum]|uniref:Uncharacterized protein n=1 Tax=Dactylosporangium fulvum TaxID=53359 RepID=A0ABY5W8R4_9ACTN|nr:hypothetical protein [Dactylosporangium fulvum]UWP85947.1 hypothetical protein Dfulv_17510 [Dactylosporangium fulvum]